MNRRLSEAQIRATCRELLAKKNGPVSGRRLCLELRERFGAVGKATRVFQIWREETAAREKGSTQSTDSAELQRRLAAAELAAAENLARAERAEYREQAHQDKWAVEIDRLRQELRAARGGR
jgi:DNA primase